MQTTRRTSAYLRRESLLVVDDHGPAKVKLLMLHLDEASGLEEGKAVVGVRDHFPEVCRHLVELLAVIIITRDELFVGNHDRRLLLFLLLEL